MKNKLITGALTLGALATLLGIIAINGINDDQSLLSGFHLGVTATFLGTMGLFTLISAKI